MAIEQSAKRVAVSTLTAAVVAACAAVRAPEPDFNMTLAEVNTWNASRVANLGPVVNSPYRETGVTISADGRTLLFVSDRPGGVGGRDIWTTSLVDGQWSPPVNLGPTVNSPEHDGGPSISPDGTRLFFNSNRPGGLGAEDIYVTTLVEGRWTPPVNLGPALNSPYTDGMAYITKDGRELYFHSNRPGGRGGMDIWRSEFRRGRWQRAVNLGPEVNSPGDEWGPYLSNDGLALSFSTGADRFSANPDERIQIATRKRRFDARWTRPVALGPTINQAEAFQACREVSADGKVMFFISNRPGSLGQDDIWMAQID